MITRGQAMGRDADEMLAYLRGSSEMRAVDERFLKSARDSLAASGASALELLAINPGVSVSQLAGWLGGGCNAVGLTIAIFREAESRGLMRDVGKSLLAREIIAAFPNGWPSVASERPAVKIGWSSMIKRHAADRRLGDYASRIVKQLAIKNPPPDGWLPLQTDDPRLGELFDRFWPSHDIGKPLSVNEYREFWERRGASRAEVLDFAAGTGMRHALRESGLWEELLLSRVVWTELQFKRFLANEDIIEIMGELLSELLDPFGDNDEQVLRTRFIESGLTARGVEEWLCNRAIRAITAQGHAPLEVLATYPVLPPSQLALVLNRGACYLGLVVAIYRDAEAKGQVRAAAKELLLRGLLRACRDGWAFGGQRPMLEIRNWSFYAHRYLCDLRIDQYLFQIERELILDSQPSGDWKPAESDDALLNGLFDRWWPVWSK